MILGCDKGIGEDDELQEPSILHGRMMTFKQLFVSILIANQAYAEQRYELYCVY